MINFLDGKVDKRPVVSRVMHDISTYAVVANPDGTYEEVALDTYNSDGYLEPIYGQKLTYDTPIDASFEELEAYRLYKLKTMYHAYEWYKLLQVGDKIVVVKGRKYAKGLTAYVTKKYVSDFNHGRISIYQVVGQTESQGMITVNVENIEVVA